MIKHRVVLYNFGLKPEIDAVECERETASYVYIKGRRSAKRHGYTNYYDTWDEAYSMLLAHARLGAEAQRKRLEFCESVLAKILEMRKPE